MVGNGPSRLAWSISAPLSQATRRRGFGTPWLSRKARETVGCVSRATWSIQRAFTGDA